MFSEPVASLHYHSLFYLASNFPSSSLLETTFKVISELSPSQFSSPVLYQEIKPTVGQLMMIASITRRVVLTILPHRAPQQKLTLLMYYGCAFMLQLN